MAIKINSTEVISNSRQFKNIAGASGKYDDLRTSLETIDTVINFNTPIMNKVMTANTTFSESNKSSGKVSVLTLDTSSTGHTPTFSANIKWANDTEPTWADNRYWHIGLVCWDSAVVRAVASGYGSTGGGSPSETVELSGTSGAPNDVIAESVNPNPCTGYWKFKSTGVVMYFDDVVEVQHQVGVEWCNVTPSTTYYIRATEISGQTDALNSDALNTWHSLASDRQWASSIESPTTAGSALWKIEIATDSGGSNIIATGYYRVICQITP